MKFVRAAGWISVGLVLAVGVVHAQEKARPVKGSKAAAKRSVAPAKPDTAVLQKARREAAARAKADEEARQRAEAETRKQAEIEAKEKPLRDADELLKAGNPADAYALLEPLEFDRSGEVRFDYLLGIAALDSGKPDKATLAFERVLAVDPDFAGARLDMARAYYQLGDMARAKTEFELVMKQNPPAGAKVTIQKYLDAIAAIEQAKLTRISGYIEGVAGHDSNIANSSTQSFTPTGTFLAGITFPPAAKLSGSYEGINAGMEISRTLNDNWGVFASADMRQHGNMVHTLYDSISTNGQAGVSYAEEQDTYRLSLTGGQQYSANSMRRDSVGVNGEWQHVYSPTDQLNIFVQYGQNRATGFYATSPTTDARIEGDTNLFMFGESLMHVMNDGKQLLFGTIYAGEEWDVAPPTIGIPAGGRVDGKKNFGGFRAGMKTSFMDRLEGLASFGWQRAGYRQINNLVGGTRNETLYDLTVAAVWSPDKLWMVTPQVALSQKKSNISLYSFDRMDFSLTIRRNFQ